MTICRCLCSYFWNPLSNIEALLQEWGRRSKQVLLYVGGQKASKSCNWLFLRAWLKISKNKQTKANKTNPNFQEAWNDLSLTWVKTSLVLKSLTHWDLCSKKKELLKTCVVGVALGAKVLPGKCCIYLFKLNQIHRQPWEGRGRRCHFPRGGQRALLLHPASASLKRGAGKNPRGKPSGGEMV